MSAVPTKPPTPAPQLTNSTAQQDLQKAASATSASTMSADVAAAVAASGLTGKDVGRAVADYLQKLGVSGSTKSALMHLLPEGDEPGGKANFHSKSHGTRGADGTTQLPTPSTSTPS